MIQLWAGLILIWNNALSSIVSEQRYRHRFGSLWRTARIRGRPGRIHLLHRRTWRNNLCVFCTTSLLRRWAQLLAHTTLRTIDTYRQEIEKCVATIHVWCSARRLQLNPDKTESILFGSRHFLQQLPPNKSTIQVCDVQVKLMKCIRNLGVLLDSELNMRIHISEVVSVGFFHLRCLRQLRKNIRQKLVSALILSQIDYCNTVFAGLPASTLLPLQRLINAGRSRPFQHCNRYSQGVTLAPNPTAHHLQTVYHDARCRSWNCTGVNQRHGCICCWFTRKRTSEIGFIWNFRCSTCLNPLRFTGIFRRRPSSMECSSCWPSDRDIHKRCVQEES